MSGSIISPRGDVALQASGGEPRSAASGAIALYARATPGFDDRVAQASALLQSAALEHAGRIVQATSLGAEDMVLTDLVARQRIGIAVATLDTGLLHTQTIALVAQIEERYRIAVEVYRPHAQAAAAFVQANGANAMYKSLELRKACCGLRKLEPLSRMLAGRSAWVTGLRREQSGARAAVRFSERDDAGRVKFNPLANWSWADVWHYIEQNNVPCNPLHDAFMPSIGCAPCTRAIPVGADFRSGRWWWESESAKECGLHVRRHADDAQAASPSQREGAGEFAPAQADFGHAEVKGAPAPGRSHSEPKNAASPSQREGAGGFAPAQADFGHAEVKGAPAPGRSHSESAKECGLHVNKDSTEEIGAPA